MKAKLGQRLSAQLITFVLIGATLTFAPNPAGADLIFADSFDYPTGSLIGKGPPPGSPPGQGAWRFSLGAPRVVPMALEFPGVFSDGKTASLHGEDGTDGDRAAADLGPVTPDIGVVWVGFLVRRARGLERTRGFAVVALGNILDGPIPGIGMLFQHEVYGIDNDTGLPGARSYTDILPSKDTVWLVTKLDFTTAQEYVWANPAADTEPMIDDADAHLPMTDYFLANGFAEVQLRIGFTRSTFQFDELRVGTTFADVVDPAGN